MARSTPSLPTSSSPARCVSRSESRWPDRPRPGSPLPGVHPGVSRSESRWPDRHARCHRQGREAHVSADRKAVGQIDAWTPSRLPKPLTSVSRSESRWPDRLVLLVVRVGQWLGCQPIGKPLARSTTVGRNRPHRQMVSADRKAVGQIDRLPSAASFVVIVCQPIGKPLARSTERARRKKVPPLSVSRSESRWPDRRWSTGDRLDRFACQPIGKPLARSTTGAGSAGAAASTCQPIGKPLARSTPPALRRIGQAEVSADRKAVGQIDFNRVRLEKLAETMCQPIGKPLARSTQPA